METYGTSASVEGKSMQRRRDGVGASQQLSRRPEHKTCREDKGSRVDSMTQGSRHGCDLRVTGRVSAWAGCVAFPLILTEA